MKIDLCKAYDTMNWHFLKEMMVALNFPHKFIKIIMTCITSTSYVLMINGSPTNSFAAKQGLRQGDPLSPLQFVIGIEYMSRSLKSFAGTFAFHPRCKTIKLTHLCFADDLMIFCKGDLSSVRIICDCIQGFSNTSGLHANSGKLAIYLAGVDSFIKEDLRSTSQFTLGTLPFKYLGVPLSSKRFSIADCEKLADMMIKRISSWQAKHLSYAARLQLINSVLMGISSYWCQIFILAKKVINIVNSICRSFLWFGVSHSHKPENISWKEVCTPKKVVVLVCGIFMFGTRLLLVK